MKVRVQVIIEDEGQDKPIVVREVFDLTRGSLATSTLGLGLEEGKSLLAAVQEVMTETQVNAAIAEQVACPDCGTPRRHKDTRHIVVRTLFGKLKLPSPRLWHCPCTPQPTKTVSPVAALVPDRTAPELLYLESKFAGLLSYGLSARLLEDLLPIGRALHPEVVRGHLAAVAQRLENELGDEQVSFIDTCPRDRQRMPRPDMPLTVGLDGGYVHSTNQRSRTEGWFEVIAGKSLPADGPAKCFGFVQTYDTKPKRRLFEVLKAQGMQDNQQITFLTDGGEDIRDLPLYLNPQSEHLLDWFHVTMRLTVLRQMAKGLPAADKAEAADELERLKWFLWHGNVLRALQTIDDIQFGLEDIEEPDAKQRKLLRTITEFGGYIRANAGHIPNYGERYRANELISTSFVESTVNQVVSKRMVKKQQMRWTPRGAHLLLQIRTRVLNGDLGADFQRWYPNFTRAGPDLENQIAA